ncbi:PilZ domain-containing protein [Neiella sp. HB171785]|uniref:PilZ domain-containing protein n=1 Tax=Neiella litorisoli TaxID=2771431 RepID=A0A8J6QHV4_9GAMM|nr:PilZ domain-containing protein [Neiella litorisoli]MBD1388046.1 PilZ domain-containing protein [Neiella litorisoli]
MIQKAIHDDSNAISEALLACPINSPLEVEVLAGSHVYRLRTRLVGIDVPNVLLLRYGADQSWQDARHVIEAGQPVVLRMVNEIGQCQVLAFRSTLGVSTKVPRKWLTVRFPEAIEAANMREQKRIRVNFGCYIEFGDSGEKLAMGDIIDLSSKGCRIATSLERPIGDGANIHVRFKGDHSHLSLPGIVRNASYDAQGRVLHGIQFDGLSPELRAGLTEVMLANY